jgi:hypothetical protein
MSTWTYRQSDGKAASKIVPPRLRIPCWKGLGADSEEKREPASDIDTVVVDGLKALDPNVWTRRALQEKAARLGCTVLHQCIRPRIGAHAPGHHGNPRASDLINGHASKGSWGHQFSGALERPFLHLFCFSRRPRWADDRGVYITFLLVVRRLLVRPDLRGLGCGPHRCDLEVATAMENAPGAANKANFNLTTSQTLSVGHSRLRVRGVGPFRRAYR